MQLSNLFTRRPSLAHGLAQIEKEPNAVLLDVRTPEEYAAGHLPGAINLPLDALSKISLDKESAIFTYCYSGARSARACTWLKRKGFHAVNLGGVMGYQGTLVT